MARKSWPIVVGAIGAASAAAVVSVIVLRGDDEDEKQRERALVVSRAAELEREAARLRAEAEIRAAQEAALAAAEEARVAAEKEKAERELQLAREKALEAARTQGILGSAALTQGGTFASLTGTGDISSGFDDTDVYGGLLGNEAGEMAGGFGFGGAGAGQGGGGTGEGTIGLGRYGTLGHGSGTGEGYGVGNGRGGMRGRTAAVPSLRLGALQVAGELDSAIVRRYVRRSIARLQYCYEKQLLVEPQLSGKVTIRFEIGADGAVTSSEGSGVNEEVASCMASVMRAVSFPKPKSGGVSVTMPLAVAPAGS